MFKEIINHLRQGGLIIYPTETAYGLGCDATNQKAVDEIFKIKKRSKIKTLPLIVGSLPMAKKYGKISKIELELVKKYWPGALTLVVKKKAAKLASGVVAKDKTIALRVSGNVVAFKISLELGKPLVSTSANLSGVNDCYSMADLKKQFPDLEKFNILVVDGGKLKKKKSSTIIKIVNEKIKVLRQGEIKID